MLLGSWLAALWVKILGFFSSDKSSLSMKRLIAFIVTIRFVTYNGDAGEYIWAMVTLIIILLGAGSAETIAAIRTGKQNKVAKVESKQEIIEEKKQDEIG